MFLLFRIRLGFAQIKFIFTHVTNAEIFSKTGLMLIALSSFPQSVRLKPLF